jgi:hypothetical protein
MNAVAMDTSNVGPYDGKKGFRIDGSRVAFWGWKKDAEAAAVAIGWPKNMVEKVYTRFWSGYALKQTQGGFLTPQEYEALQSARTN